MRTLLLLVCGTLFLSGCATVVDKDAMPAAEAQEKLALAQCNASIQNHVITNVGQYVECELAAERTMVVSIKLKDMSLFEAYAGRMRLTAQQADAKQITPDQMSAQFSQARNDLDNQIINSYDNDMQRRARIAAAFSAMGESMQREADRQAYIQAHNQTLNCTSTAFGSSVNTTCH